MRGGRDLGGRRVERERGRERERVIHYDVLNSTGFDRYLCGRLVISWAADGVATDGEYPSREYMLGTQCCPIPNSGLGESSGSSEWRFERYGVL